MAGVGGSRTPGLVFLAEEITPQVSFSDQEDKKLSAKARVSRFRAAASPLSRQLARMMAAAPVSLPVIRLIQKNLLSDSNAVHVAEVLMGGLLKPTPAEGKDGVTGEVNYNFYEGVREELIKITPKSKTVEVISCLSKFVNEELLLRRSVKNFEAMLLDPDVDIDPDYLPFAQITAQTLQLLGGKYADLGEQIQQKITANPPLHILPLQKFKFEVVTVNAQGQITNREQRQAQYYAEDLGNNLTLEMVAIPGGKFMMGSPEGEGYDEERPQHEVTVQPFYMGKYPVTQAQWRTVTALPIIDRDLNPDPSRFKGDNLPVECVSWYDVVEFCARLSKASGNNYRLPSEAEWEYACRAGTVTPFHFGETLTSELANYDGSFTYREEAKGESRKQTTPVGTFTDNAFGLFDMHGNVYEWCDDLWNDNYQGAPIDGSAWLKQKILNQESRENDNRRLLRGGSTILTTAVVPSATGRDRTSTSTTSGFG